jgi:hypothetical protein
MKLLPAEQYELYRIITDYEALQDGFLDRIDDLNTTIEQIELHSKFAKGQFQKGLTKSTGRLRREFGWETLGKALEGTGLALVLVIDDERFAPIKEQLAQRKRRPSLAIASKARPTWLFTKKKAREMGSKRWSMLSPEKRKKLARKMQKASARARRKKARESRSLVEQPTPQLDVPGTPRPIDAHPARGTPSAYQMPADPC